MPRESRLDAPDLLQHVIVRGIEKRDIFVNDEDRYDFVHRMAKLLPETGTECLAWALLTNHFHLLLRPIQKPLATFMRRLLTGYAVSFNRRHNRVGHLYQNRYKSIVCDEETYLLELIRYIHLNPLRAGIVNDLQELDRYPWSGHMVLVGKSKFDWQKYEEILSLFGNNKGQAIAAYKTFMGEGMVLGNRPELVGGRLNKCMKASGDEPEHYDERVLGSGQFVERLRKKEELNSHLIASTSAVFPEIVKTILKYYSLEEDELKSKSKRSVVSTCRAVIVYFAQERLDMKGTEIGQNLRLSRAAVSRLAQRGRQIALKEKELMGQLELW